MSKIKDMDDFIELTSNITSFSHAYLFNVNSNEVALPYIKEFVKKIICPQVFVDKCEKDCNICYQIDNNEYDDFYIVNPDTLSINNEEIEKLLKYMETKSLRSNGKRVYLIYGFDRLSQNLSNKILKFLEEPEENIYAILLTENIDAVLPTIISRCQVINLHFDIVNNIIDTSIEENMQKFLIDIYKKGNTLIAYENNYFSDILKNREDIYNCFICLEKIISSNISYRYNKNIDKYLIKDFENIQLKKLINILDITNKLKLLIKKNINLNLLIDRYIIEVTKELRLCQE